VSDRRLYSRAFVWAFIANFLHSLALFGYLHLPGFLAGLGSSKLEIGVLVGVMSAAAVALRPLVGRLLDTRGRRVLARWGSVLHVAVTLAYLAVDTVGPLMVAVRVLHGVAQSVLFSTLFTIAADVVPPTRRTQGIALFGVSGLLPMSLAGLLGDAILARAGYTELFAATAIMAGLGGVASWMLADSRPAAGAGEPAPRSFFATAMDRTLLPLWVLGFGFALAIASYFTFMRTYVDHVGVGSMGLFFSVYSAAAIVLRVALGWVPDRVGVRRSVVPALLATVAGLVLLRGADSALDIALAGLLTGTGHAFVFPIISALVVARAADRERGAALSMYTALFDLGMLVGGPVLGFVLERTDYATMFGVAAAVAVTGSLVWAVWERRVLPPRRGGARVAAHPAALRRAPERAVDPRHRIVDRGLVVVPVGHQPEVMRRPPAREHAGRGQAGERLVGRQPGAAVVGVHHVGLHRGQVHPQPRHRHEPLRQPSRHAVIVRQPLHHRLQRHDARRRDHARLPHAAAEPLPHLPRTLHEIPRPREDRPHRAGEALGEAHRHRVHVAGVLGHRHPRRDRGVEDPRPVEVHRQALRVRHPAQRPVPREGHHPAAAAVVRVLEAQDPRSRVVQVAPADRRRDVVGVEASLGRRQRPRHQPRHARERARLVVEHVAVAVEDHLVARPRVHHQRHEVAHVPAEHEQRGLGAEPRGEERLEPCDRGVLAAGVVAEVGRGDRLEHRRGGERLGVAAQVDGPHGTIRRPRLAGAARRGWARP
jgi:MFS family permease